MPIWRFLIYIKDKSCEFLPSHNKISNHNNKHKIVTGQIRESEEYIVKLKQEVLELQKINKDKKF